jgi:hypothetical protein
MEQWGHPLPKDDEELPGSYLSTMVRSGTMVQGAGDGSTLVLELLWNILRDVMIALSFQGGLRVLGENTPKDLALRLQASQKAADAIGALQPLVPEWEKDAMVKILRQSYPIHLTRMTLNMRDENEKMRERVANLLFELLWLVQRINWMAKLDMLPQAVQLVARAVQVRAAIIALGGGAFLPAWQDRYIGQALTVLTNRAVSTVWTPFSRHD